MRGFISDDQRRACFANINRFSMGRIPKIGEIVLVSGDPSVGIPSTEGKVISVTDRSANIKFETSKGPIVEELGLEEFRDSVDLKAEEEVQESLYRDWLEEEAEKKAKGKKFSLESNEGIRRHKLMTEELKAKIPKLYSQENEKDPMVYVKYFTPRSNWTWYATEFDGEDTFFGLVKGFETELGYFSLDEMANVVGADGMPEVERDLYFTPKRLSEVKKLERVQD